MTTRCAIVTGAASGIGLSIAQGLAAEGHDVVIGDLNEENGRDAAEQIGGSFVKVDLSEREACRNLVSAAAERYGKIDILINNGGFQYVSPLEDFPEDTWDTMLRVMLTAPFLLTRYVWPHLKRQRWGRIVNIASIHGLIASPNKVGYISAKHGLLGLTKTAALEGGGFGITVNALCPAYVRTPLVEGQIAAQAKTHKIAAEQVIEEIMLKPAAIKKIIEPDEIADLVLFLCSDRGRSVTGSCWTVDCGWTAQ
ncbi:MAG: 3-hydroxybutyrate dehydrogenase [Desulfofustis sp.]|jgi:3-hydroxybutyrate dehydrogenase|nr:3-hydroxybutyrate dehydrogenase [Desulfofustis sp.]